MKILPLILIAGIIAALLFSKLTKALSPWGPSKERIQSLIKELASKPTHLGSEIYTQLSFFILIWFFFGTFFWFLSEFIGPFLNVLSQALVMTIGRVPYIRAIQTTIVLGIEFMSFFSFVVGVRLLCRAHRQIKYQSNQSPDF